MLPCPTFSLLAATPFLARPVNDFFAFYSLCFSRSLSVGSVPLGLVLAFGSFATPSPLRAAATYRCRSFVLLTFTLNNFFRSICELVSGDGVLSFTSSTFFFLGGDISTLKVS